MEIADESEPGRVNKGHLAVVLEALANENRLELLEQLRVPRTVGEIELSPAQTREGENPDRNISRQAVRAHLARLHELGVVVTRKSRRGGVPVDEHIVNHPRLFALLEDLRSLGALHSDAPIPPDADVTLDGKWRPTSGRTGLPRLVLVKGLNEGRVFPLQPGAVAGDGRGWIIGRRLGSAVPLDYDPFVSSQNAEVRLEGGRFRLHDLEASRNGTFLNWERLPKGGSADLEQGDVIGVGRSLLLFRPR